MVKRVAPVDEVVCRLEADGEVVQVFHCSPGRFEDLAAGWLLGAGVIAAGEPMAELRHAHADGVDVVRARLHASQRARLAWSSPPPARAEAAPRRASPPPFDEIPALFRQLYAEADRYHDTGGVHAAALFDCDRMVAHAEDVGRHNALDRVVGQAARAGLPLERLGLVLSARISGDMAQKAARSGIAWIASRSLPTTLAVEIARASAMPIIARAGTDAATAFGLAPRGTLPEDLA